MKDQSIVCNIGHFDNEIQVDKLVNYPNIKHTNIKPQVDKYTFPNGNSIFLFGRGTLGKLRLRYGTPIIRNEQLIYEPSSCPDGFMANGL